jgi:hypothetical protein
MAPKYIAQTGNGCISGHTRAIDKSGVPKEAQDDALSYGISAVAIRQSLELREPLPMIIGDEHFGSIMLAHNMLAAVCKLAPRMAHQVNRRDLAIIMSIRIPKAPAATRPHWIAITAITRSTLTRSQPWHPH